MMAEVTDDAPQGIGCPCQGIAEHLAQIQPLTQCIHRRSDGGRAGLHIAEAVRPSRHRRQAGSWSEAVCHQLALIKPDTRQLSSRAMWPQS